MTLQERLNCLKQSSIYRLIWQDKVVGLRVCFFNVNTCLWENYDFGVEYVVGTSVAAFLQENSSSFTARQLIQSGDLLVTEEELNGAVITEFKDTDSAVSVIAPVIRIMQEMEV